MSYLNLIKSYNILKFGHGTVSRFRLNFSHFSGFSFGILKEQNFDPIGFQKDKVKIKSIFFKIPKKIFW